MNVLASLPSSVNLCVVECGVRSGRSKRSFARFIQTPGPVTTRDERGATQPSFNPDATVYDAQVDAGSPRTDNVHDFGLGLARSTPISFLGRSFLFLRVDQKIDHVVCRRRLIFSQVVKVRVVRVQLEERLMYAGTV